MNIKPNVHYFKVLRIFRDFGMKQEILTFAHFFELRHIGICEETQNEYDKFKLRYEKMAERVREDFSRYHELIEFFEALQKEVTDCCWAEFRVRVEVYYN